MAIGQPIARALLSGAASLPLMAASKAGLAEAEPAVLPELTVTAATRTERQVERTPATTEILAGEELRRSGATMLDEALQAESSIFTGADSNTFSIRGGNREDMLYLVDGRRIAGTSSRSNELNRIPVSHVERIEIVKGPGSVAYGADAVAGVINVITRRPGPGLEGGVELQTGAPTDADGGERNHGALYLGGGTRDTRFRLFADALEREAYSAEETTTPKEKGEKKEEKDELSPQTFEDTRRASADVYNLRTGVTHWLTDSFSIDLEAGFLTEERREQQLKKKLKDGKTKFYDFAAEQTEESNRRDLSATAEWLPTEALELRYQAYESHYEFDRSNVFLEPQEFDDNAAESEFGIREATLTDRVNDFRAQWQPAPHHTVLSGFEHKQQVYQDLALEGNPKDDQWVAGAFVQHEWQATDRLDLVYGARHDETSTEADNTSLQAGTVYRLTPQARLRAQYAEGFKLPELRSLYADANRNGKKVRGAQVIDKGVGKDERHDLDPESSRNYEIGIGGEFDLQREIAASYDLGLFYTEYDDRIGDAPGSGDEYRTFKNIDNARAQGAELELGAAFDPQLELTLGATYLDAIDRDTRETLTNTPEWTAVAKALWTPTDPLEVQLRTRYADEVRVDEDDWDSAYTRTSLDLGYAPPSWEGLRLQGGIDNLLDESNDSSLEADPGRLVRAGVRYDF
ncbi:MAG: TonB-dependent receptor plug domain-containing protein [Halorhodospira sp.]